MTERRSSAHTASILTAGEDMHSVRWIAENTTQETQRSNILHVNLLYSSHCVVLMLPDSFSLSPSQMTKLAAWQTIIGSGSYHSADWQLGLCVPTSLDFQSKLAKHIRGGQNRHCPLCWSDYRQWEDAGRWGRSSVGLSREVTNLLMLPNIRPWSLWKLHH